MIVPRDWENDGRCLWPPIPSFKKIEHCVTTGQKPDESWIIHEVTVIKTCGKIFKFNSYNLNRLFAKDGLNYWEPRCMAWAIIAIVGFSACRYFAPLILTCFANKYRYFMLIFLAIILELFGTGLFVILLGFVEINLFIKILSVFC